MFDYDVVIIGGGPAGLTAGTNLSRNGRRVLVIEKEFFGGPMINIDWVENHPKYPSGVSGAELVSGMASTASEAGVTLEQGEVVGIDLFSRCKSVNCADGKAYTSAVVIIAGGTHHKKLGVPGEEALLGRGVFECAMCDGGLYANQPVAVCGGGDSGVTEALFLTKLASRVTLLEKEPALTASALLRERAAANPKLEQKLGVKIEAIVGEGKVEGIRFTDSQGKQEVLNVNGILVRVGRDPNTAYLADIVPLDAKGLIIVNDKMETEVPNILAVGDIRSGAPNRVAAASSDGEIAGATAERLLQETAGA